MRWITSVRLLVAAAAALAAAGCGLGETAATSAAGAASEVQQAQQAKATEDSVQQQVDAASRLDAQKREAAEKQSQ
ncbi:MAG: hypothetical protein WBE92_03335 [Steroidobacteraceae bacterium]